MLLLDVPVFAVGFDLVAGLEPEDGSVALRDRPLADCFTVAPVSALLFAAVVVLRPLAGVLVESDGELALARGDFPEVDRADFTDWAASVEGSAFAFLPGRDVALGAACSLLLRRFPEGT